MSKYHCNIQIKRLRIYFDFLYDSTLNLKYRVFDTMLLLSSSIMSEIKFTHLESMIEKESK